MKEWGNIYERRGVIFEKSNWRSPIREPCVVTIGFFDGVHKGHQHLLLRARQEAAERKAKLVVITFTNSPRSFVSLDSSFRYITTPLHKRKLLHEEGVDFLVELMFTQDVRLLPAEEFIEHVEAWFSVDTWVVGEDTCFGSDRRGTPDFLYHKGQRVLSVKRIYDGPDHLSSSRVRAAITDGDIPLASHLLHRPFSILTTIFSDRTVDVASICIPPRGRWSVKCGDRSTILQVISAEECFIEDLTYLPSEGYKEILFIPNKLKNRFLT